MQAPDKTREQLIAEERAAERAVVEAEMSYRLVEATSASDEDQAAACDVLVTARRASLATRQQMTEGLDAWTRFFAWREVQREAEAAGVPVVVS